jgi:hypothetical protein
MDERKQNRRILSIARSIRKRDAHLVMMMIDWIASLARSKVGRGGFWYATAVRACFDEVEVRAFLAAMKMMETPYSVTPSPEMTRA